MDDTPPSTAGLGGVRGEHWESGRGGTPTALGGVEEAVEGVVGRLQVKEHLADLGVVQLVRRRHAAQGGQPGAERERENAWVRQGSEKTSALVAMKDNLLLAMTWEIKPSMVNL